MPSICIGESSCPSHLSLCPIRQVHTMFFGTAPVVTVSTLNVVDSMLSILSADAAKQTIALMPSLKS